MKIQDRLEKAKTAGAAYAELSMMFDAVLTTDPALLETYRRHQSPAIRFASYCNSLFNVSLSDLKIESLVKFAAAFNPSTSTEALDAIALNQLSLNPVITDAVYKHKSASKEYLVFYTIADLAVKEDFYQNESEKYFLEAIFDENYNCRSIIDLESLEALFYLYILGFIEAPIPTDEFWEYFLDSEPTNLVQNLELFGNLPAIPDSLYDCCESVVGARSIAAAWTRNQDLMRKLAWDRCLIYSGVGGLPWQDSRSPRSCVASNEAAPLDLLQSIFRDEVRDLEKSENPSQPILWHLSFNSSCPEDVLDGITSLIENGRISDEYTQLRLLVGESDDYPYGLITNRAVRGELRRRVEKLVTERNLDPKDFELRE